MNKQRKVVITTTYNEMGIIIDTKAEEVAQPDLQPTCNQLATDTISRQAAIDALKGCAMHFATLDRYHIDFDDAVHRINMLPSAQPEPCEDAVSRRRLLSDLKELTAAWGKYPVMEEQIKGVETAIGYVETIPSVTPERKKGKWIPQDMNKSYGMVSTAVYYYPKCSVCGWSANNTNFCPNCGADMR